MYGGIIYGDLSVWPGIIIHEEYSQAVKICERQLLRLKRCLVQWSDKANYTNWLLPPLCKYWAGITYWSPAMHLAFSCAVTSSDADLSHHDYWATVTIYVHLFSYSTCTAPLSDPSISQYANYKFYCNSLIQTWVTAVQDCVSNEHVNIHLHAWGPHTGDWYHVKLNVTIPSECDGWVGIWNKQSAEMVHRDMNIAPRVLRQTIQYQSGASVTMGLEAQSRDSIIFTLVIEWMQSPLNTE